jgi:hypothetical protein
MGKGLNSKKIKFLFAVGFMQLGETGDGLLQIQ